VVSGTASNGQVGAASSLTCYSIPSFSRVKSLPTCPMNRVSCLIQAQQQRTKGKSGCASFGPAADDGVYRLGTLQLQPSTASIGNIRAVGCFATIPSNHFLAFPQREQLLHVLLYSRCISVREIVDDGNKSCSRSSSGAKWFGRDCRAASRQPVCFRSKPVLVKLKSTKT